jgi:hypothetical protein
MNMNTFESIEMAIYKSPEGLFVRAECSVPWHGTVDFFQFMAGISDTPSVIGDPERASHHARPRQH